MRRLVVTTVCLVTFGSLPAAAGELKVGDVAPNFTLQASDGHIYVGGFQRKTGRRAGVVSQAYTRGCTLECKSLAEHGDMVKMYDAKYFMISVDPLSENTGFAARQHADFPLLSDTTKKPADAYGVLRMIGRANRWTFYIGKDGRIPGDR